MTQKELSAHDKILLHEASKEAKRKEDLFFERNGIPDRVRTEARKKWAEELKSWQEMALKLGEYITSFNKKFSPGANWYPEFQNAFDEFEAFKQRMGK